MDRQQLQEAREFAVDAALEAGRLTLEYFQTDVAVERKSDDSPVTIADRKAEELLRDRIGQAFPTHGILGEEHGESVGSDPARWILDPIDGTFSFICGVPLYCNLIGLEWQGEMVVGVINVPGQNEIVHAARGLGAMWNDRPARVSSIDQLSQARLSTTSSHLLHHTGHEEPYRRLRAQCLTDRCWPDAYGHALLATGRVDIVADSIMNIWDTAALLPVVTEAGGTLTDWQGTATHKHPQALSTNGPLLPAVLPLLQ